MADHRLPGDAALLGDVGDVVALVAQLLDAAKLPRADVAPALLPPFSERIVDRGPLVCSPFSDPCGMRVSLAQGDK